VTAFHVPSWFYIFAGAVLVISGVAQIVLRAKAEGSRGFMKPGALFSLLSVLIGCAVIYFGLFIHH
jgi:uncharacterized membrane protein HdeD (DUF308 family)